MWKQLQNLPRHEHNHAFLLRHFGSTDIIRSWFDSTIQFDSQIHCDSGNCSRRVCKMPNGKMLAVCNDNYGGCPDLPVTQNDIRLHALNLLKIAGSITADAEAAFLFADAQLIGEVVNSIRVGFYMPRGTIRYPVFLSVPIYDGDLNAALNYLLGRDAPAIMLLPSLDDVSQAKLHAVQAKGLMVFGLQDLQGEDCLLDAEKATAVFEAFFVNSRDPDPEIVCKKFPTPSGQAWEQFIFEWQEEQLLNQNRTKKAHKREVLIVTCGSEIHRYEPTDLQMMNKRSKEPTLQWALLRSFIQNGGSIGWGDKAAADNVKTQKKELIRKLKKAFWQSEDPIPWDDKKKCYQCRFICRTTGSSS